MQAGCVCLHLLRRRSINTVCICKTGEHGKEEDQRCAAATDAEGNINICCSPSLRLLASKPSEYSFCHLMRMRVANEAAESREETTENL
eukprot:2873187-Prymnesium_polylepis.1